MLATRGQWFAVSLLSLALGGCDPTQPIAPRIESVSAASPQSTVNAPSSLAAAADSQTRIELSWQDNSSNETGFQVYRSTAGPDGAFMLYAITGVNSKSYADTGLTAATQYCYKVRAVNVGKKTTSYSTFTATACATTLAPPVPPGPPAAPSNAFAGTNGSHQAVVSWADNSSNEVGFRLDRSTDSGTSWVPVDTAAANAHLATDGPVASEVLLCYRVVAFNGQGDSPPSNIECVTPVEGPTDLTDSLGILRWMDNSGIEDGYEVWILDGFGEPAYDGLVATLPPNTTTFEFGCGGLCHGFGVIAFKNGVYSDWASVLLPPGAPVNLTATAVSSSEISLTWADQPNAGELPADQFDVERCTGDASACGDAEFQIVTFLDATTFRDLQVQPGTTYTYRVRAWINVLYSDFSNLATARVP
jgi:fibronectin type III domain protein